jgi:hypothetical protein
MAKDDHATGVCARRALDKWSSCARASRVTQLREVGQLAAIEHTLNNGGLHNNKGLHSIQPRTMTFFFIFAIVPFRSGTALTFETFSTQLR